MKKVSVFWFRRDLRLHDNAGLYHALKSDYPVLPIFIFDKNILNELPSDDKRVQFIYQTLTSINDKLLKKRSSLRCFHDEPKAAFSKLVKEYDVQAVYTNRDYEPYAKERDEAIQKVLGDIPLKSYKDQVIFEQGEVLKDDGTPYAVWTPYSKKWKAKLNDFYLKSYPCKKYFDKLMKMDGSGIITLKEMGFEDKSLSFPSDKIKVELVENYKDTRDIPSIEGTSKLSVHLRFGTKSIRALSRFALEHGEKYLNELIWREFYQMILFHFPQVVHQSFKPKYDGLKWRNNEKEFEAWCNGMTGYPIVDAGMRELNSTGWMHNRERMIVASFLTKHLLIDWRWGEAYFAEKLIDFDLASNNGGWQWAAGCGVDAAPYFRIFNPYIQTKKFDPELKYIRKWVPELDELTYPLPIVDHKVARERCLKTYKAHLN